MKQNSFFGKMVDFRETGNGSIEFSLEGKRFVTNEESVARTLRDLQGVEFILSVSGVNSNVSDDILRIREIRAARPSYFVLL